MTAEQTRQRRAANEGPCSIRGEDEEHDRDAEEAAHDEHTQLQRRLARLALATAHHERVRLLRGRLVDVRADVRVHAHQERHQLEANRRSQLHDARRRLFHDDVEGLLHLRRRIIQRRRLVARRQWRQRVVVAILLILVRAHQDDLVGLSSSST